MRRLREAGGRSQEMQRVQVGEVLQRWMPGELIIIGLDVRACGIIHFASSILLSLLVKKSHRRLHKKECRRIAAELFDEVLFKMPPPGEECPICCLPMPLDESQVAYMSCCCKLMCAACLGGFAQPGSPCPFCRAPSPTYAEGVENLKKRMAVNDGEAFHQLASAYQVGELGLRRDLDKALELWLRGAELGHTTSQFKVGNHFHYGDVVEQNVDKAKHYFQLAAIAGHVKARHNVGCLEQKSGDLKRACRHWIISASAGHDGSLHNLRVGFIEGIITKSEYEKALRAHKESNDAMKGEHREIDRPPGEYEASIRAIWGRGLRP